MNRNAENSVETNIVEEVHTDQSVQVTELRALTITEMDMVGGGNFIGFLD